MAYVYYGLVLLQPSLVAAVLTPTAPNASAACGAAPIDYAGNVVTAAGAPPHLATAERALSLSPTPQPIQTNSQPSHEPLLPSPSPHPAQPSPSAGELPGLALAAFLLERLGRRRTIAFFFVASAVLTWLL